MAEVKFGLDQANKPAPLWFRRLNNAMTLSFMPGYVAVVQMVPMSDSARNIHMMVAAGIPFLMNGIGQLLGNGQKYVPSNEQVDKTN